MKRSFSAIPGKGILASTSKNYSSDYWTSLEGLTEDTLYQVWDNNPEYSLDDAMDSVLDHVIMIITEMDDDGIYEQYKQQAETQDPTFVRNVEDTVRFHYNDYEWYNE